MNYRMIPHSSIHLKKSHCVDQLLIQILYRYLLLLCLREPVNGIFFII